MTIRIGVFGDVVGRAGREVVADHMARVRDELRLDAVVLNIENSASGFGFNKQMVEDYAKQGVDVMITGNHAFDHKDAASILSENPRVIRPGNYPKDTPGRGVTELQTPKGLIVVAQVMGRVFMNPLDCPFRTIDTLLAPYKRGLNCKAILVDVHGEATSEKMALGHYLDGRATLVEGTHTHAPTADLMIFPGGTAYQTDLGMTGDYHSVIGFDSAMPIQRFLSGRTGGRLNVALGDATLTGLYLEVDPGTGAATRAEPIRVGGHLAPAFPQV